MRIPERLGETSQDVGPRSKVEKSWQIVGAKAPEKGSLDGLKAKGGEKLEIKSNVIKLYERRGEGGKVVERVEETIKKGSVNKVFQEIDVKRGDESKNPGNRSSERVGLSLRRGK